MKNEHLIKYKNPVLIKDEEGKVKQTTYDLPGEKHTYGKKNVDDPTSIKNVVNGWAEGAEVEEKGSKQKNFKQLNKLTTMNGLFTAKQQTQFRKYNDITVKQKKGEKVMPIMLPEEEFTYGVSNRPSTPVKLVIGNCYAIEQDNRNATMYQKEAAKQPKNKTVAHKTKSQLLREQKVNKQKEYRAQPIEEDRFKMAKYTKTGTRTDTHLRPFYNAAQSVLEQSNPQVA